MIDIKFITEKEIPYPKLMDTADGNLLVLFEAACRGVVLYSSLSKYEIGQSINPQTMEFFHHFNGAITLSNK